MANAGFPRADAQSVIQPRPEAEVLWIEPRSDRPHVGTPTGDQHQAAIGIHALLRSIAKRDFDPNEKAASRDFLADIDETRVNRNLLIDGDRGVGKTSLLVTLLDLWTARLRETSSLASPTDARSRDLARKATQWGFDDDLHLVPVRVLDLHPIPKHIPVLLHIAERLARVAQSLQGEEHGSAPAPWQLSDSAESELTRAWHSLLSCIVAQWDNGAPDRWKKKDDDALVVDLDRGVREQHDLPNCFTRFMNELTKRYQQRFIRNKGEWPLFIVPIDDADMQVDRVDETLDAIRMLTHPRLAFLLTGHSELFELAAELHAHEDLKNDLAFASKLARLRYEKVVPTSQRFRLPDVDPSERFRLVPALLTLPIEARFRNFEATIDVHHILSSVLIREVLPGSPRALRDLNAIARPMPAPVPEGRSSLSQSGQRALTRSVLHLWNQSNPPSSIRHFVTSALYESRIFTNSVLTESGEDSASLPGAKSNSPDAALRITLYGYPAEAPLPLESPEEQGQPFCVATRNVYSAARSSSVQRAMLGALTLAELVTFLSGDPRSWDKTSRPAFEGMFAWGRYQRHGSGETVLFAWPFPEGLRLVDLCLMSVFWDRVWGGFKLLRTGESPSDLAARWFVTLIAQLRVGPLVNPWAEANQYAAPPAWDELFQVLRSFRTQVLPGDSLGQAFLTWATTYVPLLAAPESGLPVESCRTILTKMKSLFSSEEASQFRERADKARLDRASKALGLAIGDGRASQLIDEIDGRCREHPWFEDRSISEAKNSPSQADLFVDSLARAQILLSAQRDQLRARFNEIQGNHNALLHELTRLAGQSQGNRSHRASLIQKLWQVATAELGWPSNIATAISSKNQEWRFEPRGSVLAMVDYGESRSISNLAITPIDRFSLGRSEVTIHPLLLLLYSAWWDLHHSESSWKWTCIKRRYRWTKTVMSIADDGLLVPWLAPKHVTFHAMFAWQYRWNQAIPRLTQRPEYLDDDAELRNDVVLHYITDLHAPLDSSDLTFYSEGGSLSQSLRSALQDPRQERARRSESYDVVDSIREGLALLLTPESGLPDLQRAEICSELEEDSPPEARHQIDGEHLESLRRRRVRVALKWANRSPDDAEQVLEDWDRRQPPTHWREYIEHLSLNRRK